MNRNISPFADAGRIAPFSTDHATLGHYHIESLPQALFRVRMDLVRADLAALYDDHSSVTSADFEPEREMWSSFGCGLGGRHAASEVGWKEWTPKSE